MHNAGEGIRALPAARGYPPVVLVELVFWFALSVLVCDFVFLRPVLFGVFLGREILSSAPAGQLPMGAAIGRALRRAAAGYVAVTVAAVLVVVVVLATGQWSGLVLLAGGVWGVRAWRRHRRGPGSTAQR